MGLIPKESSRAGSGIASPRDGRHRLQWPGSLCLAESTLILFRSVMERGGEELTLDVTDEHLLPSPCFYF